MVKLLATSPHDPLGITDSDCKNQSVMVSVQYGPFNTYIPIRSTTIGKSRVARDPITMHTSWRSNSDIACVTSLDAGTITQIPSFNFLHFMIYGLEALLRFELILRYLDRFELVVAAAESPWSCLGSRLELGFAPLLF
ncbi:hypothetical protein F511_34104 [Dorcoceras hygrometricum]|uniref:Uncharacterized protein n=1 Tax=Dorcoceras hygrometricum TaxID=472368 RepID=A0A2Z7D6I3_9LAMI|nr:hypothetical protein F511_34104 [Dorcoceras hygrometricum]